MLAWCMQACLLACTMHTCLHAPLIGYPRAHMSECTAVGEAGAATSTPACKREHNSSEQFNCKRSQEMNKEHPPRPKERQFLPQRRMETAFNLQLCCPLQVCCTHGHYEVAMGLWVPTHLWWSVHLSATVIHV